MTPDEKEGAVAERPWVAQWDAKSAMLHIYGPVANGNTRQSDGLGAIASIDCADWKAANVDQPFPDVDAELLANARHIVLCVNAHEGLVAAIRGLLEAHDDIDSGQLVYEANMRKAIAACAAALNATETGNG